MDRLQCVHLLCSQEELSYVNQLHKFRPFRIVVYIDFIDEDERDYASGIVGGKASNGAGRRLRRLANQEHQSGRDDLSPTGPAGSTGGKRERDRPFYGPSIQYTMRDHVLHRSPTKKCLPSSELR